MKELGVLKPTKGGGLPGLPKFNVNQHNIGDIIFAEKSPDNSWVLADGSKTAEPAYLKKVNHKAVPNKRLTHVGAMPTNSFSQVMAVSDDATYAICPQHNATGGNSTVHLYALDENNITLLAQYAGSGAATSLPRAIAISPDNNYFAVGYDATPFLNVWKRTAGTNNFVRMANPAVLPTAAVSVIEFTEDNSLICCMQSNTNFLHYTTSGDVLTKVTAGLPTPGMAFSQSDRNIKGDRFVFTANTAIVVYDFKAGTFTPIPGNIPAPIGSAAKINFNRAANAFALVSGTTVELYKENKQLGFDKISTITTKAGTHCEFTPDGNYLITGDYILSNFQVYALLGNLLQKVIEGDLSTVAPFPANPNFFGLTTSKNANFMIASASSSPYIHAYSAGLSPAEVVVPAVSPQFGSVTKYPFVKVK